MAKGDRNSSFFHAKASGRRARNRIAGLKDDSGVWKDSNDDLVSIISAYFSGLYTSSFPSSQDLEKVTKNVNTKLSLQKVIQKRYATLYLAAVKGDWAKAEEIYKNYPDDVRADLDYLALIVETRLSMSQQQQGAMSL
ncbi:hypothetical protein LWI29_011284 [Acer saccharum]|uniref:Uncharacterized protein n=1 Tax=Acer saccharum TaxID=4024 RepID=A0AA39RUW7_ACESA|nr:hypothetical protein LWI29_011284 [Acer saccharum]